jgi:hypothetical protein
MAGLGNVLELDEHGCGAETRNESSKISARYEPERTEIEGSDQLYDRLFL